MIFTRSPRLPRLDPETRGVRSEARDGAGCPFSLNRGHPSGIPTDRGRDSTFRTFVKNARSLPSRARRSGYASFANIGDRSTEKKCRSSAKPMICSKRLRQFSPRRLKSHDKRSGPASLGLDFGQRKR
jgi:hypothetical protein